MDDSRCFSLDFLASSSNVPNRRHYKPSFSLEVALKFIHFPKQYAETLNYAQLNLKT